MDEPLIPLFSDRERHHASFTGDGSEYFRIWIVNLALTIVTLGIYSAWAKVRRQQYFYRHTHVAGSSFDYHGEPLAILKGRIIAFVLFVLYVGSGFFGPLVTFGVIAAVATIAPWLFVRSLRFQLHNTSLRGIRFRFLGQTKTAYALFLGYGLLTVVTFGLAAPLAYQRVKRFQHGNAAYGRSPFSFSARIGDVYHVFIVVWLVAIGAGILAFMMMMGIAGVAALFGAGTRGEEVSPVLILFVGASFVIGLILYVLAVVCLQSLFAVRMRNLLWTRTALGEHRLSSDLELRPYLWIQLTNLFLTLCSFGLFRPFAQVRLAKYVVDATSVDAAGTLDEFVAADADDQNAVGEEIAGIFDFDVAF